MFVTDLPVVSSKLLAGLIFIPGIPETKSVV